MCNDTPITVTSAIVNTAEHPCPHRAHIAPCVSPSVRRENRRPLRAVTTPGCGVYNGPAQNQENQIHPEPRAVRIFPAAKLLDLPRARIFPALFHVCKARIFPAFSDHVPKARIFSAFFLFTRYGHSQFSFRS